MSRRLVVPLCLLALVLTGCASRGSTADGTPSGTASAPPASSGAPGPSAAGSAETSSAPSEPTPAAATEQPTSTATPRPTATAAPTPDAGGSGAADACTGSDANRAFFAAAAGAVDWPVVCAVLPSHWFVSTGSYRLANGGRLIVGYQGPGNATMSLSEGAFCANADGCVPAGTDRGDASLGPLSGTLVRVDGGGFAVVVDKGENPSWLLETHGLGESATRTLAANVAQVGG